MRERSGSLGTPDGENRRDVRAAFGVSFASVVWTLISGVAAVIIGIHTHTTVLVAFGAVGAVDAVGSVALCYHFAHGLRHDQLSNRLEVAAHRVVLVGLASVGSAALVVGIIRLVNAQPSRSSNAGVALAAASLVVLAFLSARKQQVARRIASNALRSDGHLSAFGAALAAVTLVSIILDHRRGWQWVDATSTIVIGAGAASLAIVTWRAERAESTS
jgi:divalent metal cation (Fe/Co/Zn/Cd) transporter